MAMQPIKLRGTGVPRAPGMSAHESGSALLITVLVLLVVSILGTTVVTMGHTDYALSANYRSNITALNLADSGLQAAAADLDTLIDGNLGLISSDEIVIDSGSGGPGSSGRGGGRGRGRGRGGGGGSGSGDSNLQILATLFAENRVEANTQANVAGSIVTNAINVSGSARLNIWHVPSLAGSSPNGMPVGVVLTDIEVAVREWFQRR